MSSTEAPTSLDWTEYIRSRGLPRGRVLIEASAGTGKTHTLAALATLFLALGDADGEQVRIDELLLVTFSRAAAGELRARVRERLQTVAAALEGSESAAASPSHEDFVVDVEHVRRFAKCTFSILPEIVELQARYALQEFPSLPLPCPMRGGAGAIGQRHPMGRR